MLPAITAAPTQSPPPIVVATPIPGNNTVRVPPSNVPPTVSNVEINNNRGGGNTAASSANPQTQSAPVTSVFSSFIPNFNGTPTTLSLSAQTTFLTQLLSQDVSAPAKSVLAEYEKLVQVAKVKYAPSNATAPQPEPSSVFGKLIQQQRQQRPVQQQTATNSPAAQIAAASAVAPKAVAVAPPAQPAKAAAPAAKAKTSSQSSKANNSPVPPVGGIRAYQTTANRIDIENAKPPALS